MQIQTEQGFTVTAGQMALPETPEKQLKDGLVEGAKIVGGVRIGEKLIDGLNRPNDVLTTPDPIIVDREVPVFIQPTYPPASP